MCSVRFWLMMNGFRWPQYCLHRWEEWWYNVPPSTQIMMDQMLHFWQVPLYDLRTVEIRCLELVWAHKVTFGPCEHDWDTAGPQNLVTITNLPICRSSCRKASWIAWWPIVMNGQDSPCGWFGYWAGSFVIIKPRLCVTLSDHLLFFCFWKFICSQNLSMWSRC